MLTIDQILHGVAALLGQIIGRMPSPEFFIPALLAGYYARRLWHIFVYSVPCALLGTFVFVVITGAAQYAVADFAIRYLGSLLVISGFVTWHRVRCKAPTDSRGSASKPVAQQNSASKSSVLRRTFGKPVWLRNEGVWRLLQALRLGLPAVFAVIGLIATAEQRQPDWEGYFLAVAFGSPLIFAVVHGCFWLVHWVIEGFYCGKSRK